MLDLEMIITKIVYTTFVYVCIRIYSFLDNKNIYFDYIWKFNGTLLGELVVLPIIIFLFIINLVYIFLVILFG